MSTNFKDGLFAEAALFEDGWKSDVSLYFDAEGTIRDLRIGHRDESLPDARGPLIPGMVNLHSHAFQRRLVGRTQTFQTADDDFWSWRKAMFEFVDGLTPSAYRDHTEALYREMVQAGYTTVCEFHYVHHGAGGVPYENPAAMAEAVIDAAEAAGIRLCLLPVLYLHGGFGNSELQAGQLRFRSSPDLYFRLMDEVARLTGSRPETTFGYAPHSLRAVGESELRELLSHRESQNPNAPVHMHISEQLSEVNDCLTAYGSRPVTWLSDHFSISDAWCLIHATHIEEDEIDAIQKCEAVVGLCPTTEADLGDGIFPFRDFLRRGGRFGIGSDSNVSVSPAEEIRVLEYVQRLQRQKRNVDGSRSPLGVGTRRYNAAVSGGRQASGQSRVALQLGAPADLVILDAAHPLLSGKTADEMLNAHLFSGSRETIKRVLVSGRDVR